MPPSYPFYAYKEVRLDLDSSTQSSTVAIRVPTHGASTWATKTAQKRPHLLDIPVAEDEKTFKQRYLASAASIYHRVYYQSPRSFLWRVLDDDKVLSIRAVDVSKQPNAAEADLTLRFSFPSRIVPSCIAFSDASGHDILSVFVLTESKHLYTLSLRPDFFRRPSSTEENVEDWCKSCSIAAFGIKTSHRMVALGGDVLLLSFTDGALLKLERKSGGDGSEWKEDHMSEGGWGHSLRSMIPLSGRSTVDSSTAISIASPLTLLDGSAYVFTVTLDHRLRVWNLESRKIAYVGDLLRGVVGKEEETRPVIEATNTQLVRVYPESSQRALCITYSPLGAGQFKFWNVTVSTSGLEITDLFPTTNLQPKTPAAGVWTLADFSVVLEAIDTDALTLWTLWKYNTTHRVQKLDFRIGSEIEAENAWKSDWKSMASEMLHSTSLPSSYSGEPTDINELWLELILSPERFTEAAIETALAINADTPGRKYSPRKNASLPERLCGFIASNTAASGDNSAYQLWQRLHQTLILLDTQRGEALSMIIDPRGSMPWIALADGMTVVRECSKLERIQHNDDQQDLSDVDELAARLIRAAETFYENLSEQLRHSCKTALLEEIFTEPSLTDPVRMRSFYDKCDFANQVGNEEYDILVNRLGGGFKQINLEICLAALEQMLPQHDLDKRRNILPLAEFGNKLVLRGIRQIIKTHRNVCSSLLVLLILVEGEINHGEEGIQFETAAFFRRLMSFLKRLELISWLAGTQISLPLRKLERSNSITEKTFKSQTRRVESVTILEGVLRHLLGLDPEGDEPMSKAVTDLLLAICSPESEYETSTAVIQCFLLKHDRPDLAVEFSPFSSQDPFSVYIQGRAHLAAGDLETAAILFKKAAFGISIIDSKHRADYSSAGYLDDFEKKAFNAGLPAYYAHIVSLYDQQRIFSSVIDFARLALQFIPRSTSDSQQSQIRTEMHSRLFSSAMQTARFDLAASTLLLFTDQALQHSLLRTLVAKMCETSAAAKLVELPLLGLQDHVDEILAQKCQSIVEVNAGVPYHKILYAWRIKHGDFRGAAAISLERLQRLQASGDGDRALGDDGLETPVTKQYVSLINALSCVDSKQAWILSEELPVKSKKGGAGAVGPKRKVVTLQDVRREYQGELDRIAAISNDQFAFADADEMDVL